MKADIPKQWSLLLPSSLPQLSPTLPTTLQTLRRLPTLFLPGNEPATLRFKKILILKEPVYTPFSTPFLWNIMSHSWITSVDRGRSSSRHILDYLSFKTLRTCGYFFLRSLRFRTLMSPISFILGVGPKWCRDEPCRTALLKNIWFVRDETFPFTDSR